MKQPTTTRKPQPRLERLLGSPRIMINIMNRFLNI